MRKIPDPENEIRKRFYLEGEMRGMGILSLG
jgi:hypothetical protein